jgi:hypothetical protein
MKKEPTPKKHKGTHQKRLPMKKEANLKNAKGLSKKDLR